MYKYKYNLYSHLFIYFHQRYMYSDHAMYRVKNTRICITYWGWRRKHTFPQPCSLRLGQKHTQSMSGLLYIQNLRKESYFLSRHLVWFFIMPIILASQWSGENMIFPGNQYRASHPHERHIQKTINNIP